MITESDAKRAAMLGEWELVARFLVRKGIAVVNRCVSCGRPTAGPDDPIHANTGWVRTDYTCSPCAARVAFARGKIHGRAEERRTTS